MNITFLIVIVIIIFSIIIFICYYYYCESSTTIPSLAINRCRLDSDKKRFEFQNKQILSTDNLDFQDYGRTGPWIAQYYNFPPVSKCNDKSTVAIISIGGGYLKSDLQHYWTVISGLTSFPTIIDVPVGQTSVPVFDGTESPFNFENALDLELLGSIAWNSTILFISVPTSINGLYKGFKAAINGVTVNNTFHQPSVISCSSVSTETLVSRTNIRRFDTLFKKAVSKGIVICCPTGDNGANDAYTQNNRPNAVFPSTSPNVLACGGTSIQETEVAWSWNQEFMRGAGSGASEFFQKPQYQQNVSIFPPVIPPLPNLSDKRSIPDISLNSDPSTGYTIFMGGKLYLNTIAGTSAAAPIMSAFLAIINFKYPRPFNEILYDIYRDEYQKSKCFKDITIGSNDNIPGVKGTWHAKVNFDYLTGMGSIHGINLMHALNERLLS